MSASNASCDSIKLFGKQRETALLAETAESDRLPHGIMLTGEKGIGKRTFAKDPRENAASSGKRLHGKES